MSLIFKFWLLNKLFTFAALDRTLLELPHILSHQHPPTKDYLSRFIYLRACLLLRFLVWLDQLILLQQLKSIEPHLIHILLLDYLWLENHSYLRFCLQTTFGLRFLLLATHSLRRLMEVVVWSQPEVLLFLYRYLKLSPGWNNSVHASYYALLLQLLRLSYLQLQSQAEVIPRQANPGKEPS